MKSRHRLGIFGGSFDPPHVAHIALARQAVEQLALDELRIIPTGNAWHKAHTGTSTQHRLAMTRLAFADLPSVVVDARELERPGATYTFDTLQALKAEQPSADLFLFIGADQAEVFNTWHRWQEIVQLATVVVAERRPPEPDGKLARWHNAVSFDAPSDDVLRLDMPIMAVSATEIRSQLAHGTHSSASLQAWLPATVLRYIKNHKLYHSN